MHTYHVIQRYAGFHKDFGFGGGNLLLQILDSKIILLYFNFLGGEFLLGEGGEIPGYPPPPSMKYVQIPTYWYNFGIVFSNFLDFVGARV